jgi:predicted transcriptional regulator
MTTAKPQGEAVRRFIVQNIAKHPTDIAGRVSARFHITRQAVHKHVARLLAKGQIIESGQTRNRSYIFFTSRMFDSFDILSGGMSFSHAAGDANSSRSAARCNWPK